MKTDPQAFLERIGQLSPKRLALLALDLQSKLDSVQAAQTEPIAVVGMGCRFPGGASDPESYWRLLCDGVDAIGDVPADRWDATALFDPDPDAPGKVATRWGGFLDGIDQFDPAFFGISPREAVSMDPQQRLLLEVAWEALEHAGYAPDGLAETQTGVFVGICNGDYYHLLIDGDPRSLDTYVATGSAHSVASGRLSYVLGLRGPSVSVDTACSSSLVAVHLAAQSLRGGECRMALAGGVNVVLAPQTTMALSRAKMMASDGRCKAFDDAADGFVRSEGCGVVVLKRLSDARADGDRILAVIRGSAVNQDGRSNGLTAPNGPSQVAVIRGALANAGVQPADVGYVETHGTGTALGDPIEAQALGAALGLGRPPDRPLLLGSSKTNLGHLESAAGVAGLIKTVLTLQHGQIPALVHFKQPSRHIPWAELPLAVPTRLTPWPEGGAARIAGVSSFGFSGTNAHVILEAAPVEPERSSAEPGPSRHLVTLSARSDASLREVAARFASRLAERPEMDLADVAYTTQTGRAQFEYRLAVTASDTPAAHAALDSWLTEGDGRGLVQGRVTAAAQPGVAFLFPGQGAQYVGMGKLLYATQPTFRAALDACALLLEPLLDRPLLAVLWPESHGQPSDARLLDRTAYTQPATFAIEYALARLWMAWGIVPSAVFGHSAGEYVAACIAGVFSLHDAVKLVAARGRLMDSLPPGGEMASVRATEAMVRRAIGARAKDVSVAALNGPDSVVISGVTAEVEAVLRELELDAIETRVLPISIGAHSPLMDPILDEFAQVAAEVAYSAPQIDVVSCVTGQLASGEDLISPEYWRRHVRDAVRFADGVRALDQLGCRVLLEVGPTPTLLSMADRCLPEAKLILLPSLRRDVDDWQQLLETLGRLWVTGVSIDWSAVNRDHARQRLALPTSPFERFRCWAPRPSRQRAGSPEAAHPLLGQLLRSPALEDGSMVFESSVHAEQPGFVSDHRIYGLLVLPSPVYIEMALSAAAERWGAGDHALEAFAVDEALVIPEQGDRTVQLVLADDGEHSANFNVYSRAENGGVWSMHASGRLRSTASLAAAQSPSARLEDIRARCADEIDGPAYYERLRELGLEFGPKFQGVSKIWRRDGEALGRIDVPPALVGDAAGYQIHPALLDACFHVLGAPLVADDSGSSYLLVGIDSLRLYAPPGARLWDHVVLRDSDARVSQGFTADIALYDDQGGLVAEISGVYLKRADRAALLRVTRQHRADWLYEVEWRVAPSRIAPALPERMVSLTPSALVTRIGPHVEPTSIAHGLSVYRLLLPELEALSGAYVVQAFERLGWQPLPGERFRVSELAERVGVVGRHHRLLQRLVEILAELHVVSREGEGWRVERSLQPTDDLPGWSARLLAELPGGTAEISLTVRCGERLADVLRGAEDPLEVLFPNGSFELTEQVYVASPFARVYNDLVGRAVAAAFEGSPERALRILEIGAGTGATTRAVLSSLDGRPGDCSYTFTDVSPLFLARAQERFADDGRLSWRSLDVEQDPAQQGFDTDQYDLVLASNVLHATADLRRSLEHARSLLAPGGLLMLVEGTAQQRWVDLTFGLTPGWWKFSDSDLRSTGPLLSAAHWTDLLGAVGFEQPVSITAGDSMSDDLAHQTILLAQAPRVVAEGALRADWLVVADRGGTGQAMADLLQARGEVCTLISHDDCAGPGDLQRLLCELPPPMHRPWRVAYLWALDAPAAVAPDGLDELHEAVTETCVGAVELVRTLASADTAAQLWIVTRGAQTTASTDGAPAISQIPVWGLGRVVALEQPQMWGGSVDLPVGNSALQDASAVIDEMLVPSDEDQVALRADGRFVPRLVRHAQPLGQPASLSSSGTHLVTGGLGGLGLKVAHWLVEQGARHVTLLGRRGLPDRAEWPALAPHSPAARQASAIAAIEALGAEVLVVAGDVADDEAMALLFGRFGRDLPTLKGVIHAAAALGDSTLVDLSDDLMRASLRPKVRGTWVLHELTRSLALDYFVLFSSTTALWGSAGLGHYAAGNSFLDGFAQLRHALGLPALSINWGTWDEMRVASEAERARVARFGLSPMPAQQALDLLGGLMAKHGRPQLAVAAVDWPILKGAYEARRRRPFLANVGNPLAAPSSRRAATHKTPELLQHVQSAPLIERANLVLDYVRRQVAHVLGIDPARPLDSSQGLFGLGMDSLMSVELKGRLEAGVGGSLPSTLTFNYPSIAALAGYLCDVVLPERLRPTTPTPVGLNVQAQTIPSQDVPDDDDDLSEDDLASLLAARLARLR